MASANCGDRAFVAAGKSRRKARAEKPLEKEASEEEALQRSKRDLAKAEAKALAAEYAQLLEDILPDDLRSLASDCVSAKRQR